MMDRSTVGETRHDCGSVSSSERPDLGVLAREFPHSSDAVCDPARAFSIMCSMGRMSGIPEDILCGATTHAGKWHICSIMEHIRWCVALAKECTVLVQFYDATHHACCSSNEHDVRMHEDMLQGLEIAAIYHDIGKVIAPQITDVGPKYHGHGPVGADFLEQYDIVPPTVAAAIRHHGAYRKEPYPDDISELTIYLDLCDELSKWSERRFVIEGGDKQRRNRRINIEKVVAAGVPAEVAYSLEKCSDKVADSIGLVCDERCEL